MGIPVINDFKAYVKGAAVAVNAKIYENKLTVSFKDPRDFRSKADYEAYYGNGGPEVKGTNGGSFNLSYEQALLIDSFVIVMSSVPGNFAAPPEGLPGDQAAPAESFSLVQEVKGSLNVIDLQDNNCFVNIYILARSSASQKIDVENFKTTWSCLTGYFGGWLYVCYPEPIVRLRGSRAEMEAYPAGKLRAVDQGKYYWWCIEEGTGFFFNGEKFEG